MIHWNREVAGAIQLFLVLLLFTLLLSKRKKLGPEINFFIAAAAIVVSTHVFTFIKRMATPDFKMSSSITMAINFVVFLLYFLYFRQCLGSKVLKKINLALVSLLTISFITINIFFNVVVNSYPLLFYFIQVILLLANIFLVLRETFNSNKILNLRYYYPFWICIGLMTNYVGITPLLIISHNSMDIINVKIFFTILFIVNFIGYFILISGALMAKKNKNGEFI